VAEALQMLGFAVMEEGDIRLTPLGYAFAHAELDERKRIFGERLHSSVPLASHIRQVLDERPNHRAPLARFETELEDFLTDSAAQETLHT
jgi:NitT/TauT family transport system ATP-binding protein